MGDSIFKVINSRGLDERVDVMPRGGARIRDIKHLFTDFNFEQYSEVILYIGGNDVSSGTQSEILSTELNDVIKLLLDKRCTVHVCTVCPRVDADVQSYNDTIRRICDQTGVNLIECYNSFVYGDGRRVNQYYCHDGIHLSIYGSKTLVNCLNKRIHIIRKSDTQSNTARSWQQTPRERGFGPTYNKRQVRCNICGRRNHMTRDCRQDRGNFPSRRGPADTGYNMNRH